MTDFNCLQKNPYHLGGKENRPTLTFITDCNCLQKNPYHPGWKENRPTLTFITGFICLQKNPYHPGWKENWHTQTFITGFICLQKNPYHPGWWGAAEALQIWATKLGKILFYFTDIIVIQIFLSVFLSSKPVFSICWSSVKVKNYYFFYIFGIFSFLIQP